MTAIEGKVVAALGQEIAQRIGEPRYKLWFEGHTKFSWQDDQLVVGVPNRHFQEWLEKTFAASVSAAAAEVFGQPMRVCFTIDAELFQAARAAQSENNGVGQVSNLPLGQATGQVGNLPHEEDGGSKQQKPDDPPLTTHHSPLTTHHSPPAKRRWHHLRDFVVGRCNRVAHASAVSIVEALGQGPNPLVLHGPVGTGKTHLLEGIYAGLRKGRTDGRICYVTAEDFTNRFLHAMHSGKLGAFRKHFRECEALLVDDLHFLAKKRATQEEFLHTFDALHADNRQVVVSCDCHPKLAGEFTPELTDRLLGGAVWGMTPPDAETRLDILRAKSMRNRGESAIPDDVLRHLAEHLRGNVRELEAPCTACGTTAMSRGSRWI